MPFEIVLDSGAADHVADPEDAPGQTIVPSAGSKRGAGFLAADGERIANQGQMELNLLKEGGRFNSTFQACKVNRPLWSVSKICRSGYEVLFTADGAQVRAKGTDKPICSFEQKNGLYVFEFALKRPQFPATATGAQASNAQPAVFARQGR